MTLHYNYVNKILLHTDVTRYSSTTMNCQYTATGDSDEPAFITIHRLSRGTVVTVFNDTGANSITAACTMCPIKMIPHKHFVLTSANLH